MSDYDPDLILGQNEDTGDWQVFLRHGPHDGQPFPVFTLGKELPPYDVIQRKLYDADVRRHGRRIADAIERKNETARKALDDAGHDAAGETAESIEWGMRKLGMLPNLKIFVPSAGKE